MKFATVGIIAWFAIATGSYDEIQDSPEGNFVTRDDVCRAILSDGSELRIEMSSRTGKERKKMVVDAFLYSKNVGKRSVVWSCHLTSVDYVPERESYYALVKEMKDHIFIFSMWNNRYSTVDRHTGQVLQRGVGDDVLKQYGSLVPLRLTIPREVAIALHGLESVKFSVEMSVSLRQRSTFRLFQAIPGSKLKKFYVVQFETHRGERPGPDWRPIFAIVWKAESLESIDIYDLAINGQPVHPPTLKNAIYALEPDYSLRQLPITAEETNQLFTHVSDIEKRQDQRLACLVEFIEQKDPRWKEWMSAVNANEELFPPNPYWEQKVDPHLKVVEPP